MSKDTTSRPSTEELTPSAPAVFLPCSDCRAPMQKHYYALDSRPICARCRMGYDKRIAYGRGPGSLGRMLVMGGGAALAGAAVMGVVGFWMGFLRLLCATGVAYFVAKAINKATGDYYMRRNQVVAVALVWFSISLAALVPILIETARYEPEAPAAAVAAPVDPNAATADSLGIADLEEAEEALREARVPERPQSLEEQKAAQLRSGGIGKAILIAFVLFLTLPIVSAFGLWGLQAAAISLVALGVALFKAWNWTSDGVSYQVSGPHRVGTGPIPTTW